MATSLDPLKDMEKNAISSQSMDLVDQATTEALDNCFNNVFKESIRKYMLKQVIKQEIENLSTDPDKKNIINKINALKPDCIVHHSTVTSSNINTSTNGKDNKDGKKSVITTCILLIAGYLRENLSTNIKQIFAVDITSICNQFIGDPSNVSSTVKVKIYQPSTNTVSSLFLDHKLALKPADNNAKFDDFSQPILISNNKIIASDNDQTLRLCSIKLPNHRPADPYHVKIDSFIAGAQYLMTETSRLLRFGGCGIHHLRAGCVIGAHHYPTNEMLSLNLGKYANKESKNPSWKTYGSMRYKRSCISLCEITEIGYNWW